MAKLPRVTVVQFGSGGPSSDFGQFGSKTAGNPQTSQNPTIIMQLAAWLTGWTAAAIGAQFNPYLEDMNGFCFVVGYLLSNIFERGIAEYDSGTVYYRGAYVQDPGGSGQRWYSLQDNNQGNTPPASASNAFWHWDNPPTPTDGGLTNNAIPKASGSGPAALIDSAISDNGTNVVLSEPLQFPDGSVQSSAQGQVSVQNVVTGSRALNTVFRNNTGKPLYVSVTCQGSSGGGNFYSAAAYTDSNAAPTTLVAEAAANGNGNGIGNVFFIVLPGNYYEVKNPYNAGSLLVWTEWQ